MAQSSILVDDSPSAPILMDDSLSGPSPSRRGPMSFGNVFRLLIVSGALILLTVYAKALAATPELVVVSVDGAMDDIRVDGEGRR
jgi:hypothetical protein